VATDAVIDALERALLDLDHVGARRILGTVGNGVLTAATLDSLVAPVLVRLGDAWGRGDVALSQVYMSGRMCERLINSLDLESIRLRADQPRIAIGVLEDAHVLGEQIVLQMLRSAGYAVHDLGIRLTVNDIVNAVRRHQIEVLVLSVLMLRSALRISEVRERLAQEGLATAIVVGGAPFRFDPSLASEIGVNYAGITASDILPIMAQIERARS
jgi:monomethylamine corrinoid protein